MLLHITTNFQQNLQQEILGNIFSLGGSCVEIFFVLIGFIIAFTNLRFMVRQARQPNQTQYGQGLYKMYDKFAHILRIKTTVNDVTFFKYYRMVIHRDGSSTQKEAAMKKYI